MRGLIVKLKALHDTIEQTGIMFINSGGCCVVAAAMAECFDRLGIPCDVVTPVLPNGYDEEGLYVPACKARVNVQRVGDITDWKDNGLSLGHLAARFQYNNRVYIWDTDGLYRNGVRYGRWHDTTDEHFGTGLTADEAYALAANKKGWNSMFDRKFIPTLTRTIRITMLGEDAKPLAIEHWH